MTESCCFSPSKEPKVQSHNLSCLVKVILWSVLIFLNFQFSSLVSQNGLKFLPKISFLQIYDSSDSEVKLNDVFEFVGVFTFDNDDQVNVSEKDELADDFCEDVAAQFPTNKVMISCWHSDTLCCPTKGLPRLYHKLDLCI